jgi:hypothetical protein
MRKRQMADLSKVDDSLARFEAALRLFEAAVLRAGENRQESISTRAEAEALRDDRARLSGEVHAVRSKAADLADKNRQATARVDTAMAKIRSVLGG